MIKSNHISHKIFLLLILLSLWLPALYPQAVPTSEPFNVLIVNSYHMGHKWETHVMEGFARSVENYKNPNVNIKVEYLDFRNRNDAEYLSTFKQLLEAKYPKGTIDVIYTIDDEAYEVLYPEVLNEESAFHNIPLFFSGVNQLEEGTPIPSPSITGIYQRDVTLQLLHFIFEIDDTITQINVVTENSNYGLDLITQVKELIHTYWRDDVAINLIQSDYIEDIQAQLAALPADTNDIVILGGEFQHRHTGIFLEPHETVSLITSAKNVPIYSNDQTYLTTPIVGGCIDIGQEQGRSVFLMMQMLMEGTPIEAIPSRLSPNPRWIVNYTSIYDHDINVLNIPQQSIVINKKFYQLLIPTHVKNILRIFIVIGLSALIITIFLMCKHFRASKKARQELQNKVNHEKLRTDFIINLSHELRTPINVILTALSLLKNELAAHQDLTRRKIIDTQLDNINKNTYRLLKLSNNIVDSTKLEAGKLTLNKENWNIVEVVEDIFTCIVDFAHQKEIHVIFDTEEEEILCAIDKELIQRVILNLLSNAIKFTPKGGQIHGYIRQDMETVTIEITDTGIGIPEDKLSHIFYRFYQIDNSLTRVNEGSGIGLCIVKDIITLHDGDIRVESQLEKGSRFIISLPNILSDKERQKGYLSCIETAVNVEMSDVIK